MQKGRLQAGLYCVVHVVIILVDSQWFGLSRVTATSSGASDMINDLRAMFLKTMCRKKNSGRDQKLAPSVLALARIDLQKA